MFRALLALLAFMLLVVQVTIKTFSKKTVKKFLKSQNDMILKHCVQTVQISSRCFNLCHEYMGA